MSDEEVLKIVILGEGRVGKTSILSKYFSKKFDEGQKSTINPSFYELNKDYQGKKVYFKFWDTAGQEQFNAINTMYYQNAVGALLVYDVTISETFEKVKDWVHTLQEMVGKDITFVIAGNKFDLSDKNMIEKNNEKVDNYCAQQKCKHFYTSAKTGFNLNDAFDSLINSVLKKVMGGNTARINKKGKQLSIKEQTKPKKEGGCCK